MVRRLVEEQDVRLRRHDAGQRHAPGLAARKLRRILVAAQPKLVQQRAAEMRAVHRAQAFDDIIERRREAGKIRLLRQITQARPRLQETPSGIGIDEAGSDLEQGRFAGAVAADKAKPVAGGNGELGLAQQRRVAEAQADGLEGEKRGGHERDLIFQLSVRRRHRA